MGKIIKNIVLILIGFLLITAVFAAFSQNPKVNTVPLSDLATLLNQGKITTLTVADGTVTAKVKDSDTQDQSKIGSNTDVVSFFKNTGVDPSKLTPDKVQIQYDTGSVWSNLAGPMLSILLPFALVALFIYFLMRQVQGTNNRAMSFGQSGVKIK